MGDFFLCKYFINLLIALVKGLLYGDQTATKMTQLSGLLRVLCGQKYLFKCLLNMDKTI